jgi:hypothetical protein
MLELSHVIRQRLTEGSKVIHVVHSNIAPIDRPRQQVLRAPGVSTRRCVGITWCPNHVAGPRWIPCSNYASPWITDVAYCSHHMPPELMQLAHDRVMLWEERGALLWRLICAEVPIDDGLAAVLAVYQVTPTEE